jgi:sugar diacid utilization regulator
VTPARTLHAAAMPQGEAVMPPSNPLVASRTSSAPTTNEAALITGMQGLLVLSMLMNESGDERAILRVAGTAVPSLIDGRLHGVYLHKGGWQPADEGEHVMAGTADLEAQFAVLSSAGGAIAVMGQTWGWAYPLRSLKGQAGFFVVSAMREPPPEQQFLLRVLSQQTGIALSNTSLHTRERSRSTELREANEALEATVAVLQRGTTTHRRLDRVAVDGEGIAGIAAAVNELTGYPVTVEDPAGNVLASAGSLPPSAQGSAGLAALLARGQSEGRPVYGDGRLLVAISAGSEVLGSLTLIGHAGTADEHVTTVLEHGATVLAMEMSRLQSVVEVELRMGRDVVDELLVDLVGEHTVARAQALGFDTDAAHRVAVVSAAHKWQPGRATYVIRRMGRLVGRGSLFAQHAGSVVLLTDVDRDWAALCDALCHDDPSAGYRLGVGGVSENIFGLPRAYREAQLALRMFDLARLTGGVTVFDDLGVFRLLAEIQDRSAIERYVRTWLGALIDYDTRHGGSLVETLGSYLNLGGSYDATSTAVAVHRSTLRYRLQRIRDISGRDLNDPDVRFNLQLATRALETLNAVGGGLRRSTENMAQ